MGAPSPRSSSAATQQLSCYGAPPGLIDKNIRRDSYDGGHLHYTYPEFVRTIQECLVWTRPPLGELNSSPKIFGTSALAVVKAAF